MSNTVRMATSVDDVERYANEHHCSMAYAAAKLSSPLIKHADLWPKLGSTEKYESSRQSPVLISNEKRDLLTEIAVACSEQFQYPASSVWLHGLAVIASACTRNFRINYHGDNAPVNLYCVTSQPPSTGKSGINNFFSNPITAAYESLNKKNALERRVIQAKIDAAEKDLNKTDVNDRSYVFKLEELERLEEKLNNTPIWSPFAKDVTPEAMEVIASQQCGMVNIVSAEAEALTILLGDVYKDSGGGGSRNFSMLLSMWDNEYVSSDRISRKGFKGYARGSVAVMAQDAAIDSILKAGQSGRGIAERFLLLAEPEMLGKRDHTKWKPVPQDLKRKYIDLVTNIVCEERLIILQPSKDAVNMIANWRNSFEPKLARGGEYESNLIRGFMGKADKQVLKIASTLHVINEWQEGGSKSINIDDDCVMLAIAQFEELAKTYINAADTMGYTGDTAEVLALADKMTFWAEKGRTRLSIGKVVDNIKRSKPFNGIDGLTSKLKRHTLPELEKLGYCVVVDGEVFLNPRLK